MSDSLTNAELVRTMMEKFLQEFRDEKEALQTAADLAEEFCE